MLTLIMWHNRFSENENEAVEAHIPRHRDSKTRKPRHRGSKTKKPRHRGSKTKKPRQRESETNKPRHRDSKAFFQRTKSNDIAIPRPKNHDTEIEDQKATTLSSCGILTFMPPDRILAEQSEYHGIVEYEKSSGTT